MAGNVYVLLVGVDNYPPPVNSLHGCRNDVASIEQFLRARIVDRVLDVATLLDDDASRDHIIDAFRGHLQQAGVGDVALFVFAGHGSEETAPPEPAALGATARLQVLVCADTGQRVGERLSRGIADKELAMLIHEVSERGPHVAVILDCCHSGSGTRDPRTAVRRWLPRPDRAPAEHLATERELASPRHLDDFLPGTIEHWSSGEASTPDHIALSACQSFQVAKEQSDGTQITGVFTAALLASLAALGPGATYRELLAATRAHVERTTAEQTPALYPVLAGGPGDGLILDGTVRRGEASFHVTTGPDGLEVDAGLVHGLREPNGDEHFELTCMTRDGDVAGQMRVAGVEIGRSRVEPIGWTPSQPAYRAVVSIVPLPKAVVMIDDETGALVRQAIESCGPGGGPSAHVRVGGPRDDPSALVLRIETHPDGYSVQHDTPDGPTLTRVDGPWVRLLRADGTALTADVPGADEPAARRAVGLAEHVAQWEQVRGLTVPGAALAEQIIVELVEAGSTDLPSPGAADPLGNIGVHELHYRWAGVGYLPPQIRLRVTNTSDGPLYVALLDLTDRFACRVGLFPTQRLAAGEQVLGWEGAPIPVELPARRAVEPGAMATDWIKVIVSEADFDASAFELHALDEPRRVRRRASPSVSSTLERMARRALTREVGPNTAPSAAPAWGARTIHVVTRVPPRN